ncbi:hypothetical protein ACIRPH_25695 [Nocardiopsis sp. NPDC101807]|uniref:hypothetical protein n=1 Tax=Nocardiopsis sp. NPDC101807 TaxID=3364339 RepID=UPI003805C3BA
MTEHGGGRDSGAGDWFKPSENRYRTQSEYQDPLEGEEADEGAETVFPDSGGYTGLSASRPALVEPYPEALGGPPSGASHPISYPGAGRSAYQPLTRVPGEPEEPSLPSVAASAEVPLPSEDPGEGPAGRMDSWAAPRTDPAAGGAEAPAGPGDAWATGRDEPEAPAQGPRDGEAFPDAGYASPDRASDAWRSGSPLDGAHDPSGWDAPAARPEGSAAWDPEGARGPAAWDADAPAGGSDVYARDAWSDAPAERSDARGQDAWRTDVPGDDGPGDGGPEAWVPARDADARTPEPSDDARPWDDVPEGGHGHEAPGTRTQGSTAWDPEGARGPAAWDADAPAGGSDVYAREAWSPEAPAAGTGDAWGADAPAGRPEDRERDRWSPDAPAGGSDVYAREAWSPEAPAAGAGDAWGADAPAGGSAPADFDAPVTGPATDDARPWDEAPGGEGGREAWSPSPGADAWTPQPPADTRSWEPDPALGGIGEPLRDSWGADAPAGRPEDRERDRWSPDAPAGGSDAPVTGPATGDARPWDDGQDVGAADAWTPSADAGDRPWDDAPSGYGPAGGADRARDEDRGATAWGAGPADRRDPVGEDFRTPVGGTAPAAPLWDDELSDDRRPSAWGADAPAEGAAGPGRDPWDAAPRHGAPAGARAAADGGRSWDDDELGSDSWGSAADRGAPAGEGRDAAAGPEYGGRGSAADTGDLDSWAPAGETGDAWSGAGTDESWTDGYGDELSPSAPAPAPVPDPGGFGAGSGNTWAFDRNDPRLPDIVREAEERRRESARSSDTGAWGDDGADGGSLPARGDDDRLRDGGPDGERTGGVPSADDPLAAIADMQSRARSREADGYADEAFADEEYDDEEYDDGPVRRGGPGGDGVPDGATQVFEAPSIPEDTWDHDEPEPAGESEYDDGFTPADYGMPEAPASRRRRKDPIAEEFPGFVDRPLGGEPGDPYPGYDSIDFLPDTERGATVTLWLGIASLLPGIGLVTALLALLVTGPKAKKAIRASRGELDGLGLITVGTVFAVVGILVTVISVAIWLVL